MSIPNLTEAFRLYLHFVESKNNAEHEQNDQFTHSALNVVMDHIASHIEEPAIQALAAALGQWDVDRHGA